MVHPGLWSPSIGDPREGRGYVSVSGAHIEQLFACLWHWGLVRNIWHAAPHELHQSVCILLHYSQFFAFGGRSATLLMDHGTMFRLMFGRTRGTPPPRKMRQRMREKCVCCVVTSAPPSQFVLSVRSTIVLNVLTPTLVGIMLFVKPMLSDIMCC